MPTKEEIMSKVREALVDALGVDDDEVTPEATLVGDLGAESIDFLDIVFRLEKAFDIKIPRDELFPEDILTSAEYVEDGKVNEAGIAKLRERMPFADLSNFKKNPVVQDFGNQLTVAGHVPLRRGQGGRVRVARAFWRSATMRWFWVDRFTEFVSGKHATADQGGIAGEEQLHDHFPGYPVMPNSMMVEGMALTGGLLVAKYNDFEERVILAKLARSRFHF